VQCRDADWSDKIVRSDLQVTYIACHIATLRVATFPLLVSCSSSPKYPSTTAVAIQTTFSRVAVVQDRSHRLPLPVKLPRNGECVLRPQWLYIAHCSQIRRNGPSPRLKSLFPVRSFRLRHCPHLRPTRYRTTLNLRHSLISFFSAGARHDFCGYSNSCEANFYAFAHVLYVAIAY